MVTTLTICVFTWYSTLLAVLIMSVCPSLSGGLSWNLFIGKERTCRVLQFTESPRTSAGNEGIADVGSASETPPAGSRYVGLEDGVGGKYIKAFHTTVRYRQHMYFT
jgi:hypothetical protein